MVAPQKKKNQYFCGHNLVVGSGHEPTRRWARGGTKKRGIRSGGEGKMGVSGRAARSRWSAAATAGRRPPATGGLVFFIFFENNRYEPLLQLDDPDEASGQEKSS